MPSERVQRQIDRLLDEAEAAAAQKDWAQLRSCARGVLAVDLENSDALAFLAMAEAADQKGTPASPPGDTPSPEPSPLPTSFAGGRYAVRSFLGEGAKKRVYLAHDSKLDRDVAFALIKTDGLDADGIVRVRREAQAMGRLGDNAHIVTVFDTGDEGGAPYIVSQLMAGGSVEDLLAKADQHRIPPDRAMKIGEQVCQALAHAHGRSVIHRDLKPGNVWLDSDGNAALGDFGLAIAIDRSRMTMQGMMVGTVAYMAPEQALGRAPDARSDLYSLGAMLYEMVAGRPPFLGDDAVGVISQHINTAPVAPTWHEPSVPSPLESLILRLLAKSPDERPQSAQDVANELHQILARSTITEHPHGVANEITDLRQLDWGRFVGRRTEMDQLKASLESALSGKAALAFIAGEPGIGKTRLAEEFAVYAELRGAQVLTGRSYEGESSVPYRPFVEALRQYVRSQPDGDLRQQMGPGAPEIATMISDVRQRFPDVQEAPKLEAEAERYRLFDSITTFLRNASVSRAIVLLLDDLHWTDKPSLLLLQHLARHAEQGRLLLMATYRDVELDRTHPLAEALSGFRRMERFARIPLRGLVQDEVYELLTSIESDQGAAPGRQNLAQAIWRETEGNPFFIKEVLQHLVETGKLKHEHGRWTAGDLTVDDLGIPEGVREVIGRRLGQLSESCNAALTRVSAMTRGFTWDQFRAINADQGEEPLLDVLDEALRSQLITERKGEVPVVYDFTHALIRQTLYEELSTPRRVLLHRQIATALEGLYGADDAHVGELAYHFFQAAAGGDAKKAIEYCTRAGDRAAALNGHDDAIGHYERALQIIELTSTESKAARCELLVRLGQVELRAGHPEQAVGTLRKAIAASREAGRPKLLATAAIEFANAAWWVQGDVSLRPETAAVLTEALDALGDQEPALCVRLHGMRTRASRPAGSNTIDIIGTGGYTSYFGGRDDAQVEEAREALKLAEEIGDPGLIAFSLGHLRGCVWRPENPRDRLQISLRMLEYATRANDLPQEFESRVWVSVDHLELGEVEQYEQQIVAMEGLAERTRQPLHAWFPAAYRANGQIFRGNIDEADRLVQHALELGQRANAPEALLAWAAQLSTLRQFQGRWHELEGLYRGLRESSPGIPVYAWTLIGILADSDKSEEARREIAALPRAFAGIPRDFVFLTILGLAAPAALILEDRELAKDCLTAMKPYEDLCLAIASVGSNGSTCGTMALAAEAAGDIELAEHYFERSIQRNREWQHVAEMTRGQYQFANMLVERGAPGDRERATALVGEALEFAGTHGMTAQLQQCLDLKLKLQGVDSSSTGLFTSIDRTASAAVEEKPQLWRDAIAPDGTVTIMFSDIEDSTVLTERLGDQGWQDLLRKHNALIREQLQAHEGYEVKTMGDGFMVAFQSAKKGLDCAIAIQRAFDGHNAADGEHVKVRIGLHAGEAIKERDDFYGKNVILASRVAGKAVGGEILVSSLLRQLVESSVGAGTFGEAREVELKGLAGAHTIYAVDWA